MAIYQINGPSGTGKTSIGKELAERGFKVVDTDEAFGYYANLKSERPVRFPGANKVSDKWYAKNGWIWRRDQVEIALNNTDANTFFSGGSLNEYQYYPRFKNIFRLVVEPEILQDRLSKREGDEHTNNPEFISRMLGFLSRARMEAEQQGMIVIDTSHHSVAESADEILEHVYENQQLASSDH